MLLKLGVPQELSQLRRLVGVCVSKRCIARAGERRLTLLGAPIAVPLLALLLILVLVLILVLILVLVLVLILILVLVLILILGGLGRF